MVLLVLLNSVFTGNVVLAEEEDHSEPETISYLEEESTDDVQVSLEENEVFTEEEDPEDVKIFEQQIRYQEEEDADNDELFKGYINSLLYGELVSMDKDPVNLFEDYAIESKKETGKRLTGVNRLVYDKLVPLISSVASGERESTKFSVPVSELNLTQNGWTAEELGVDSLYDDSQQISSAAFNAMLEKIGFDIGTVNQALLLDHPYEMYWYDKTGTGGTRISSGLSMNGDRLAFYGSISLSYGVAQEYSGTEQYTFDPSKVNTVNSSIRNAQNIVDKYEGVSDIDKLYGYKKEICDLVSYNHDAVNNNAVYGNPWQLIWVFDKDASTNVVCEGYSKAFQYLCDLTEFNKDVFCAYSVSGQMDGGTGAGNHMWNILHADDNKNYLVDVTNCDEGSIGYENELFMTGISENNVNDSVDNGYHFSVSGTVISYLYDSNTRTSFTDEELTIAQGSYSSAETHDDILSAEQDPDSLDLVITVNDSGLFDHLANDDSAQIVLDSAYRIDRKARYGTEYIDYYYVVSDDGFTVRIPQAVLKNHRVPSGRTILSVSFEEQEHTCIIEGLQASKDLPEDISVYETSEGLAVSSSDAEFLENLVRPSTVVDGCRQFPGFVSVIGKGYHPINNAQSNHPASTFDSMIYDAEGHQVLITSDALKAAEVYNRSGKVTFEFDVYGYAVGKIDVDMTITTGRIPLPEEGIDFNAYQNNAGDIIIESENKEWLRSLADTREHDQTKRTKYGSVLEFYTEDYDCDVFFNSVFSSDDYADQVEIYYDEQNECIYIPYSVIKGRNIPEGREYTGFYFNTYSYQTLDIRQDSEVSFKLKKGYDSYQTYAILHDRKLTFFLSKDVYENGGMYDVTIGDSAYQGTVYADFGSPYAANGSHPWGTDLVSVSVAEGQTVSPVTIKDWFSGCFNLNHVDLSGLDTSGVTSMARMFNGCRNLASVDVSHFDTSNVTDMSMMFAASGVRELDLSGWDTSKVTNMNGLFETDQLKKITLGVNFKNWSEASNLPEGTWTNGTLSLSTAELQSGFEANAQEWAGTWTLVEETGLASFVHVTQDTDSGDIVITSDNAQWLQEFKDTLEQDAFVDFDFAGTIRNDSRNYFDFEYDEEESLISVRISHEALLQRHVRSNAMEINFPATENFESFDLDISGLHIEACKEVPEGLKVKETDEGIILYFEEAGDEEIAFFQSVVRPATFNNETGEPLAEGGSISIVSEESGNGLWNLSNQNYYLPSSDTYRLYEYFRLSEDSTYVCIPVDTIINHSSLVISDAVFNVSVEAYGYVSNDGQLQLNGLKHASKPLSDGFNVSVSMDDQMNVYIRSNDPEWLEALCKERTYGNDSMTENGGSFALCNEDLNHWISFSNSRHINSIYPDIEYELRTDEQTNERYVYLGYDVISIRLAETGVTISDPATFYFDFHAYGYESYRTDAEMENGSVIISEDPNIDAPVSYVYEDQNGNLVIMSTQTEAFNAFIEAFKSDYRNHIFLSHSLNNHTDVFQYLYRVSGHSDELIFEDGKIIISNDALLNRHLENGVYDVEIGVVGYHQYRNTIDLTMACSPAPAAESITVLVDEQNDLVITSQVTDWIAALSKGFIEFGLNGDYHGVQGTDISINGNQATVSKETLSSIGLEDGDYQLILSAYKYGRVNKTITLSGYVKPLTAQVSVSAETGDLIVICEDEDYLNALAKKRVYNIENHEYKELSSGGRISIRFPNDMYVSIDNYTQNDLDYGNTYENEQIVVKDGQAVVSNMDLMSYEEVYDTNAAEVTLHAPGYKDIVFENVSFVDTRSDFAPQNVTVTEEENGDLIIDCENKDWLKALTIPSVYLAGTYKRGGSIMLKEAEHDYYSTYSNSEYGRKLMSYDEDRKVIIVHSEGLKYSRISNGSYGLRLQPYKYKIYDYGNIEIHGGLKQFTGTFSTKINEDRDLVISSSDTEWLKDLGENADSYLQLIGDNGNFYYFDGYSLVFYEGDVVIDKDELTYQTVEEGTYTLEICPASYASSSVQIALGNYCKTLTEEVNVRVENGSLIIECDDADFLNGLVKDSKSANEEEPFRQIGGYMLINSVGNSYVSLQNGWVKIGEKEEYWSDLRLSGNSVIVSHDTLIERHVKNSDAATVYLKSFGYKEIPIEGVKIEDAIEATVPDDIRVKIAENGDLQITSLNTDWLMALCEVYEHSSSPSMMGGELCFKAKDGKLYEIRNTSEKEYYSYQNGMVVLSADKQIEAKLYNGTYSLYLQAYKYDTVAYEEEVTLKGGYRLAPEEVQIGVLDADIVIRSDDTRWKEVLTADQRSVIKLKNDNKEYVLANTDLVSDEQQITLSADALKRNGVVEGTYDLYLFAYGYDGITEKVTIDYPVLFTVSVIQDPNTLDLVVTGNDETWISEMSDLKNESISFSDSTNVVISDRYDYVRFDKLDGFTITHEGLLANHVGSGRLSISFPYTESQGVVEVDLDFDLKASKPIPEGLKVEETADHIRFYFDDPGEEEKAFIEELAHYSVNGNSQQINGTRIYIREPQLGYSGIFGNARYYKDASNYTEDVRILLSEDKTNAYISNDTILRSNLVNIQSRYDVDIEAYGYTLDDHDLHLSGLNYACIKRVDDFWFKPSFDAEGNLILNSNDEGWLEALVKPRTVNGNDQTLDGGFIILWPIAEGLDLHLVNEYDPKTGKTKTVSELKTDGNGKKYVFISRETLYDFYEYSHNIDVTGQEYYFMFQTYGYENYNSDETKTEEHIIFSGKLIREVPDSFDVSYENQGVLITSNDAHWLDMLTEDERSKVIFHNEKTSADISFGAEQMQRNENGILISSEMLKKYGVKDGVYSVTLRAFAYKDASKAQIAVIDPDTMRPMIDVGYANVLPVSEEVEFKGVIAASDDLVSSWNWDFGDGGSASAKNAGHSFGKTGEYEVKLTVKDVNGNSYTASKIFTVFDPNDDASQYTLLKLMVVDSNDASPIEGASIFLTGSSDDAQTYEVVSGENGYVEVIVSNDAYNISAVADGFMARAFSLAVDGGSKEMMVSLYASSIMTGEMEVTELTKQEAIDLGIDVDAPENQHVYKYESTLTFRAGLKEYDVDLTFIKNLIDLIEIPDPIEIDIPIPEPKPCSEVESCHVVPSPAPCTKEPCPVPSGGGGGGSLKVKVYPISEKFTMVVYGEAHWLKEMFQAALIVNNVSLTDTFEQTTAVLDLPNGMSLTEMVGDPQSSTIDLGTIDPKGSQTATWFLRGDAQGDYHIGAHVTAIDMVDGNSFGLIEEEFVTRDPVHVYAGSALKLTISTKDVVERGEEFAVKYRLENVSNKTIYDFTFGLIGSEEYKVTGYTDRHEEYEKITGADFGETWTRRVDELAPGGYVELELSATIWFKSILENGKFIPVVGSFIDIAYYLDNLSVVSLSGSTTDIPYEIVIERGDRDYLVDWLIDNVASELIDLPDFTLGGTIIEVIGGSIGLPVSMIKFAQTWLKLQQGETDYVMSITVDDGQGTDHSIENDVVRMTVGDTGNAIVDVLNGNKFKLTAREIKIESKMPGSTRLKFSVENSLGEMMREFYFDVVVEDNEVKSVVKVSPDEVTGEFKVNENEMKVSAEQVKNDTIDALNLNPFQWIDSSVKFDLDQTTSSSMDGYSVTYFNEDKSGGGVLWTKTHNGVEITGTTATLDFTREAWQNIAEKSGDEFTIVAKRLSDSEAEEFGVDQPIYQFKVETDDDSISELNGSVYVAVPYELTDPENADAVYVEHFKADGSSETLAAVYNSENNTVSFATDSFSYFVICEGEPKADTLTLDQETMELLVGEHQKLNILEGAIPVEWSSNNEDVAQVDENGMVTAVGQGVAIITVTSIFDPELKARCIVTVTKPVDPYGDILPEDRPDDPDLIPKGFWTSEMLVDENDPYKQILYTGKPITLSFRVYDHNKLLEEGTDYTVKYSNNTKAGTATVTITGKGNYTGTLTKTFTILPEPFNDKDTLVILGKDAFVENGKAQKPTVTVTHNGVTLKNKTDYILSYEDSASKEVGTYELYVEGKGNYEGLMTKTYRILDKGLFTPVSSLKVTGIKNFVYTGEEIKQTIKVMNGKTELVEGVDYELSYVDNENVGTAYVVIEGTMNEDIEEGHASYAGTLMKSFKITAVTLSAKNTVIEGFEDEFDFDGEAKTQDDLLILYGEKLLEEGVDYTLTYKNNIKAGTAAVTVKGMGNFKGSFSKTYKIQKVAISDSDIDLNDSYEYTKGGVKPLPMIIVNGRELILNTDYTLAYKNNTKLGTATMTVKAKGSYTGTSAISFDVVEADIGAVKMTVADKVVSTKANGWKSTPVLTDTNGKKLAAGTDYSKTMIYTYTEDTTVVDGSDKARPEVLRKAGEEVLKNDILPVNTVIEVTVNTEGLKTNNYTGEISETYRIVAGDIAKATVTIPVQYYTGDPIEFTENEITVKVGKVYLTSEDYEIVSDSYENNINKGTAYVTIRGIGDYGGTKRVKFTIKQKTLAQTIHFNPNGATSGTMKDQLISKNTALTKNAFKKTGKTFAGWAETEDGPVVYTDKQVYTYDPDKAGTITTLYAVWR